MSKWVAPVHVYLVWTKPEADKICSYSVSGTIASSSDFNFRFDSKLELSEGGGWRLLGEGGGGKRVS